MIAGKHERADIEWDGKFISLLAGPFPDEATARKYEWAAYNAAMDIAPWVWFDRYGVTAIDAEDAKPGKLNHLIDIDPADLLPSSTA